jgi:hypothetical protein
MRIGKDNYESFPHIYWLLEAYTSYKNGDSKS